MTAIGDDPLLRCEPSGREVAVTPGTPVLEAVAAPGLPLGRSCDGEALCGFCRVLVVTGADALSPVEGEEREVLASLHAEASERPACCARIHGRVTVTTTYWQRHLPNRCPHLFPSRVAGVSPSASARGRLAGGCSLETPCRGASGTGPG